MAHLLRGRSTEDPLNKECADRLVDRLKDVIRDFQTSLVLGGAGATLAFSDMHNRTCRRATSSLHMQECSAFVCEPIACTERARSYLLEDNHVCDPTFVFALMWSN
jgi:hypothetical protein